MSRNAPSLPARRAFFIRTIWWLEAAGLRGKKCEIRALFCNRPRHGARFENGPWTGKRRVAAKARRLRESDSESRIALLVARKTGIGRRSPPDFKDHEVAPAPTGKVHVAESSVRHSRVPGRARECRQ